MRRTPFVQPTSEQLRRDALTIWMAGLDAVRSDALVRKHVRHERDRLFVGKEALDIAKIRHILVVGAGKAGAGMSAGLEAAPARGQKAVQGQPLRRSDFYFSESAVKILSGCSGILLRGILTSTKLLFLFNSRLTSSPIVLM